MNWAGCENKVSFVKLWDAGLAFFIEQWIEQWHNVITYEFVSIIVAPSGVNEKYNFGSLGVHKLGLSPKFLRHRVDQTESEGKELAIV